MKEQIGKDSLLAIFIAVIGTLLLNANTLIATIRNNRAKDRETDVKEQTDLRSGLEEISSARRQSWLDCREELAAEKAETLALSERLRVIEAEKKPLRFRAEQEKRLREHYEETLLIHDLICLLPARENISKLPGPAQP